MKINKDQVIPSRWRKLKFEFKRGSGHLFAYLMNRIQWHYYPRFQYTSKFPDHVDIEISSTCDMKCPMCYTTTDKFKNKVKRQFMDFGLFKKIVDECVKHGTYSIRLSFRGEPFIHKDVIEMIRYAKNKGIKEVSSLTNNLTMTPSLFKEVLDAGLDWLTISFDGLAEKYEWIRQPAKFDESLEKIKDYKRIKDNHNTTKPVIKVQSVWPAVKSNVREYFELFDPYVDDIAFNPLIDYLRKDREIIYDNDFVCPVLYQRLVIGSDGIALLCICDELCLHPIGDANKEYLFDIWHGKKMINARETHKKHKGVELLEPCKDCYLPRRTQRVIKHLGDKEIYIDKFINRPDVVGK